MVDDSVLGHSDDRILRTVVLTATQRGYEEFCDDIEDTIFRIFLVLQDDRHLYYNLTEDQISGVVKSNLKMVGYDATIGQVVGGATDLLVKKEDDQGLEYKWIAEAKLYKGPAYLYEGFLQLTTRYLNPQAGVNYRGALLIYRQETKISMPGLVAGWRNELPNLSAKADQPVKPDACSEVCGVRNSFFSEYRCARTGVAVRINHLPLDVLHEPKDKSARARKGG